MDRGKAEEKIEGEGKRGKRAGKRGSRTERREGKREIKEEVRKESGKKGEARKGRESEVKLVEDLSSLR